MVSYDCDPDCHNSQSINKLRNKICNKETIEDLAATFKILGDPVRVSILQALSISEMCVCDIAELLNMSHSAISHQLRLLRTARMVRYKKEGRKAIYRLDDHHVYDLIKTALEHLDHEGCNF